VLVGDVAHRKDWDRLQRPLPDGEVSVRAAWVHRAERCPWECPNCRPLFETMLSYQLERSVEALVS
jgi:hypothetical protein